MADVKEGVIKHTDAQDHSKYPEYREHYDVAFNVQGVKVPAHKYILCKYSEVFRRMFHGEMKERDEKDIRLDFDVEPNTFSMFIEYLYTHEVNCKYAELDNLLEVATYFAMDKLIVTCTSLITKHMVPNNVYGLYCATKFDDVKSKAEAYILANYKSVFPVCDITTDDIKSFINKIKEKGTCDELELSVVIAACGWYKIASNKPIVDDICQIFDLDKLTIKSLLTISELEFLPANKILRALSPKIRSLKQPGDTKVGDHGDDKKVELRIEKITKPTPTTQVIEYSYKPAKYYSIRETFEDKPVGCSANALAGEFVC